jgi:hypothetical protein
MENNTTLTLVDLWKEAQKGQGHDDRAYRRGYFQAYWAAIEDVNRLYNLKTPEIDAFINGSLSAWRSFEGNNEENKFSDMTCPPNFKSKKKNNEAHH